MTLSARFPYVMRTFVAAALAAVVAAAPAPALRAQETAEARDSARYLFVLGGGDMPAAGSALHLVLSALGAGRPVDVLLLAGGVSLGRKGAQGPDFPAYGASGPEMLAMAMDRGAEVTVCQMCLRNNAITLDDMAEGIGSVNALQVLDMAERADVVLSFASALPETGITLAPLPAPAPAAPPAAMDACDPATDIDGCM